MNALTDFAAKIRGRFAAMPPTDPESIDMTNIAEIKKMSKPEPGSSAWLFKMVEEANEPQVEVVDLTPTLAKTLLDLNPSNRSIRRIKVLQYASDMVSGRWALNGEPIIVSTDGSLNDGQHRCLACIEANTTIPAVVMFGIERDTRLTVDQGAARGPADFLGMEGVPNAALVGAIARMVIAYEANGGTSLNGANKLSSAEIRNRVAADAALAASATFGITNGHYSRTFAAGSVIGFAHYILSRVSPGDAETFLSRVCRGDGLRMRDPAHTLREKLIGAGRVGRDRKIKLIIQAWNFSRRGMKVAAANMNSELPFPALI